jgi:hypothetical protein
LASQELKKAITQVQWSLQGREWMADAVTPADERAKKNFKKKGADREMEV